TLNSLRHYVYYLMSLLVALFVYSGLVFAVARRWTPSAQAAAPTVGVSNTSANLDRPNSPGDWPMYGHDVSRTNYNPDETTINSGNVSQLVQRWQVNIGT